MYSLPDHIICCLRIGNTQSCHKDQVDFPSCSTTSIYVLYTPLIPYTVNIYRITRYCYTKKLDKCALDRKAGRASSKLLT